MPTKEDLAAEAEEKGINPDGLSKAELEEALKEPEKEMSGQSEPYYPQQRRHENQ